MKRKSMAMLMFAFVCTLSMGMGSACGDKNVDESQSSITTSSDNSQESESADSSDTSDSSDSAGENEKPENNALVITAPEGEVFPYVDQAKAYLQAGDGADVADYWVKMDNAYAPVQVQWEYNEGDAAKFCVEYATKEDFSDALSVEVGATKRSADLYNLYRGTNYYVRVTAMNSKGKVLSQSKSEFQTTSLGPRVMKIDAIHNVRDLGGYQTSFGKTIVQGIAYRGGSLTPPPKDIYTSNLTDEGKQYMSEVLGIKGELDFRNPEESGIESESVIPGATLTYITVGGYSDVFTRYQEGYRKIFSYFADENNYPMYYHCTGGADRTGTVTFLLHALLGVSELECVQGYEFTSFSTYNVRSAHSGHWADYFQPFLATLKTYEGNSLQEKTENYLLSIGVTETEIYNIKAIFFGEPTKTTIYAPASFMKNVDGDLVLSIAGKKVPDKLYLGGVDTQFAYANGKITVAAAQLPSLPNGVITGKVVFEDKTEVEFTMDWKELNLVFMKDVLSFGGEDKIVLTANKTPLSGVGVVGYGKTALVEMETTTVENTNGGLRVFIGSYGFECRGGEMRPYTLDANGTMNEVARDAGMGLPNTTFDGGATLYISVEFVDDKPVLTIKAEKGGHVYEHTYTFASRVANEITDENATMTFWIRTDAVTSLTIYK